MIFLTLCSHDRAVTYGTDGSEAVKRFKDSKIPSFKDSTI